MWNPAAFIKWRWYNEHYEHTQRLDELARLMSATVDDLVGPFIADLVEHPPDYEFARLYRRGR